MIARARHSPSSANYARLARRGVPGVKHENLEVGYIGGAAFTKMGWLVTQKPHPT
jgi:hypothetical protein